MTPRLALLVMLWGLLSGCSGGRDAARTPGPSPEPPPRTPATRTVQGFRIQIVTTPEKPTADRQAAAAQSWWEALPVARRTAAFYASSPEVDVTWKPPYYRVQLGAFATRNEAGEALALTRQHFADAFLVPATVTITR